MRKINIRRLIIPAKPESGQQIVMMAFLMIGLIAALGLAIDGGRLYLARRDTQNAVDAAIMAATHALCTGRDPIWAGEQAAKTNGLDPDDPNITVTIANPPIRALTADDGTLVQDDVRYFVDVYITKRIESFFIHVVYSGELSVTSDGVGFCTPPFDPHTIPAIWAGATTCNNCGDDKVASNATINWTGADGYFTSPGGLFFSNGDIAINGNTDRPATIDGGVEAHCETNLVDNDKVILTDDTTVEPGVPEQTEIPLPFTIEDFMPGGYFAERAVNDPELGIYFALTPETCDPSNPSRPAPCDWYNISKEEWVPNGSIEGLFYVQGDVDVQKNRVRPLTDTAWDTNVDWSGVTIAATGEISFNGGQNIVYYIGGIILFSDFNPGAPIGCSSNETGLFVSAETFFEGVIVAPWSGVHFSGPDTTIIGAILAQFVDLSGSNIYYEYNPDILDPIPPRVQMAE